MLLACSDDSTGPVPVQTCPECRYGGNPFDYPMHHQDPTWSRQDLICFEDLGVVRVDSASGLFVTDSTLAGLWVLDPTSGDRHRVAPFGRNASWSPNGLRLAFSVGEILTISANGTGLMQLTFSGGNHLPSWSPSGELIAYDDAQAIWVMRSDGTDSRNVGDIEEPRGSRMPSWSPDGNRILHIRYLRTTFPTASAEVFVMDASGTGVTRLTYNQTDDRSPVFSPDGRYIAYSGRFLAGATAEDFLPQVWVMNADGRSARQVTACGGYHPSWSPDGQTIVYTRYNTICNIPENGVLWTVDLRTGIETQLTTKWPERDSPTTSMPQ
jgi:Tol biopolymer transport system component